MNQIFHRALISEVVEVFLSGKEVNRFFSIDITETI